MTQPTIDEIRDQIAEWEGWTYGCHASKSPDGLPAYPDSKHWKCGDRVCWTHPIPYTLDEAAKLPEGWLCWISNPLTNCEGWWLASARHVSHDVGDNITESATTEIEARFRLRHAAMKAERGIA